MMVLVIFILCPKCTYSSAGKFPAVSEYIYFKITIFDVSCWSCFFFNCMRCFTNVNIVYCHWIQKPIQHFYSVLNVFIVIVSSIIQWDALSINDIFNITNGYCFVHYSLRHEGFLKFISILVSKFHPSASFPDIGVIRYLIPCTTGVLYSFSFLRHFLHSVSVVELQHSASINGCCQYETGIVNNSYSEIYKTGN